MLLIITSSVEAKKTAAFGIVLGHERSIDISTVFGIMFYANFETPRVHVDRNLAGIAVGLNTTGGQKRLTWLDRPRCTTLVDRQKSSRCADEETRG